MRKSFIVAIVILGATTACSEPKVAAKSVADSTRHETMTAEQHAEMHGSQSPGLYDSSFARLQERGAGVMGVDQYK